MRWVLRAGALGRPRGMGNTCKSMADYCQCMAKTTTIFVVSLKKIKINEKKKKNRRSPVTKGGRNDRVKKITI